MIGRILVGPICGSVVDDDDLQVLMSLTSHAQQRLVDRPLGIEGRHDDGNELIFVTHSVLRPKCLNGGCTQPPEPVRPGVDVAVTRSYRAMPRSQMVLHKIDSRRAGLSSE